MSDSKDRDIAVKTTGDSEEAAAAGASEPARTDADGVPLKAPDEPESRLYHKDTVKKLWLGFGLVLAALVALDLVVSHHTYFSIDGTFGFYAWYGLLTCVIMVVASKKLVGLFLTRKDSYYDD